MYKNVTTEWAKTLPTGWKAVPLKRLLENGSMKVGPFGSQLSGKDFKNEGFWVYNQRAIVDENFSDNTVFIDASKYNSMRAFHVHAGDILVTTRGTIGRICQIPINYNEGIIHPCVIKFRLSGEEIPFSFLKHIFNESNIVKEQLLFLSNATTIDVIYSGTLKDIKIPVPPRNVRKKISAFLDFQCSEIDAISADIQKEIETLEQYKRSVITEAVTKGLNPDAEMKDSSVEWVGIIPASWTSSRLGYETYIRARLGWKGLKADEYVDEGYAFISAFNIQNNKLVWMPLNYITKERYDESPEIKLHIGDVIIVKDGAGIGKCARIDSLPMGETAPNSSIGVITPLAKLNYRYLAYYLQSAIFNNLILKLLNGMGVPHLTQEVLNKTPILLPPKQEQVRIANFLDSKCCEIDSAIETKKKQIDILDAYKKSLIYEYVTGKKEVPVQN